MADSSSSKELGPSKESHGDPSPSDQPDTSTDSAQAPARSRSRSSIHRASIQAQNGPSQTHLAEQRQTSIPLPRPQSSASSRLSSSHGKRDATEFHDASSRPTSQAEYETCIENSSLRSKPTSRLKDSSNRNSIRSLKDLNPQQPGVSEWSHQQTVVQSSRPTTSHSPDPVSATSNEETWQDMPAYATHAIFDDWGKVLAREEKELEAEDYAYGDLGGAGKGYTKIQLDEDAQSATSMDEDTAYLFKGQQNHPGSNAIDEEEDEEEERDVLGQMQATKELLSEGQRIAYVGLVRLSMIKMVDKVQEYERQSSSTKKQVDLTVEALKMWSQRIMALFYNHMDIPAPEQIMIEQLSLHGVIPSDLTPTLMKNARVKNPISDDQKTPANDEDDTTTKERDPDSVQDTTVPHDSVKQPQDLVGKDNLDIDIRWTVLCDLFLVLVSTSSYDARSRTLFEHVAEALSIDWVDICRFEKRITDAIEMQESENVENWNEDDHMEKRRLANRKRRLMYMGLATVGGGLVIGLSAGVLAPVIGAGLAAGFTTIGVAGTGTFLGGAGAAALITSTGVITGGTVAVRASSRRMGSIKTFEYRPLYNNKRVNLVVTLSGWMTGKVDDVRLPFSTIDPVMGDIYSVLWEPEMLQSMGQTINILATEVLTQGLQQILASTILTALMGALQLPIILTKLSYFIDNPWSVSMARADQAGLILADSLIDRNLGTRPVTLVGFSIGARVIFACLRELVQRGAYGIVQNVYLFGSPVVVDRNEYTKIRTLVSGRFVNGYATNDWILGYLFRATAGGISRVAGLAPVEIKDIEDINVTALVPGHMAYRSNMPKLMQEVGWKVESLEFSEIEDPDPDNHEQRQRELINEIEEARKELEKKPEKKGLRGFFSRKKAPEKKQWEQYDDIIANAASKAASDPNGVLFDVDAIRAEVVELASHGIQVKELPSSLPPLKCGPTPPRSASEQRSPRSPLPQRSPGQLSHSQSYSGDDRQSRLNQSSVSPERGSRKLSGIAGQHEELRTSTTIAGRTGSRATDTMASGDDDARWPSPAPTPTPPPLRDLNEYSAALPDRSRLQTFGSNDAGHGAGSDVTEAHFENGGNGLGPPVRGTSPGVFGNAWADDNDDDYDEFGSNTKQTSINMTFE